MLTICTFRQGCYGQDETRRCGYHFHTGQYDLIPLRSEYNLLICGLATHYSIAMYAIERGIHVLVTKPAVKLLSDHNKLIAAAKKHNVVCFVEHHKR